MAMAVVARERDMTEADGEWWQPFADQQLFYYLVGDMCRERARLEAQALAEEARVLLEARRRGKRGASATIAAAAAATPAAGAAKAFPTNWFQPANKTLKFAHRTPTNM